ncbi:GNAT family N-acetyltransferase [Phenylobacterium sp.]|uniref:GNAT family N-acetyltransferase n=1 Tax=Phenylobacterium sp. TaxID=1871053 RepID=UPI00301BD525
MDVRILRITAAGAGLLNRVEDDVFDHEIDPRHLAAYLADPGHLLVCAVADGVVIGQARGVITRQPDAPPALYIDNLGVAEGRRREGIASRLLEDLTEWGRANGCAVAWVATELDNDPARALYAGRGAEMQAVAYYEYALDEA